MVEFTVKPVETWGVYTSTQSPTRYTGSITHLQTDIYGNLKTQGISAFYSGTAGVQPTVIAGVDSAGSIVPWNSTSGTMGVDTELLLAADNVTITNIKPFVQSTGTQTYALVDSSTRIILAPSSSVIASITSTVSIPFGSTINIGTTGTVNFTTGTVGFPVSSTVNIPISSTVNIGSDVSTTGSISFATLTSTVNFPVSSSVNIGTTGTVGIPVSSTVNFPVTSTVNIGVGSTINFATTSSVNIATIASQTSTALGLVVDGGTIGVETEFAIGSTFSIYPFTTSTVGVSGIASTIGAAVSWATGSTMNVKWNTTSTLGAAVSFPVGSTIQAMTPANLNNTTGTIGVVRAGLTTTTATQPISGTVNLATTNATIPVSFATTSTLGAAVTIPVGSTVNIGGTVSVGGLVGSISSTQFLLGSTNTAYALPGTMLTNRKTLIIRNMTTSTVWFGGSGVSTVTGFPLMESEVLSLDAGMAVYGIAVTANSTLGLIEMS